MALQNLELFISFVVVVITLHIWLLLSRCRSLCLAGTAAAVTSVQISFQFLHYGLMLRRSHRVTDTMTAFSAVWSLNISK